MAGQWIDIPAGDGSGSFRGYLALPSAGKGPGLIVAQEIFGINSTMQQIADDYAAKGFVALAPDLFWRIEPGIELGYTEADWKRAFELFQAFDQDKGIEDIAASLSTLRARPEVAGQTGCVGYCLGGKLAYLTAARTDVDVSVGYYGVGIEAALDEAAAIKGQLVLHIAEQDQFCPPEAQKQITETLAANTHVQTHVYPGVDHAFARPGGEHFDQAAADLANQRTLQALTGKG